MHRWEGTARFVLGALLFGGLAACASTVLVRIPPAVDLGRYGTIGIITVKATGSDDPQIGALTTQKLMQNAQEAQPGTAFLELGGEAQVLAAVGKKQLDPAAIQAIGAKHKVAAVMTGALEVSPVSPNVKLSLDLSAIRAQAQVNASLAVRLLETTAGATAWTASRSGTWTLASVSAGLGNLSGGVSDPAKKYRQMVTDLTYSVTQDLRPSYERRKVEN